MMTELQKKLYELGDEKYASFQSKLVPNIAEQSIIGVRTPVLRKFASDYIKNSDSVDFIMALPHKYYDENVLHGILISRMKDYGACIREIDRFLPYVDNWAVCDIISPPIFAKYKNRLIEKICEWSASEKTYICRFGIKMLMSHFLDKEFASEYLDIAVAARSDEYYVKMMVAWFFATALAKQWESTIPYIENKSLAVWTHNKTIQKAIESFRITDEQKQYLRHLKV